MAKIELQQRKIIIKGKNTTCIDSSTDALDFVLSNDLGEPDLLTIGIYSLALLFMEGKPVEDIDTFIRILNDKNRTLGELCQRVQNESLTSHNKTENAIKEITKIALEITQNNE